MTRSEVLGLVSVIAVCALFVVGLGALIYWIEKPPTSGVVTAKEYDDQDLVCSRGCMVQPERWCLVVTGPDKEGLDCMTREEWDTWTVGDTWPRDAALVDGDVEVTA